MAAVMTYHLTVYAVLLCGAWSLPVGEDSATSGPFTGFKVLEVSLNKTTPMGLFLQELETTYKVDVWGRHSKGIVDVMVGQDQMSDVIRYIKNKNASYSVKVLDVQRLLDEHMDHQNHHRSRRSVPLSAVTRRYLKFRQIRQFLQNVRDNATHADVTLSSLGRTFEGRITPCVTIRQKNAPQRNKPVVVIEAGIHAREWIAPAMALNIIYRLTFNPNNDPDIDEMLEKFDWLIIPVLNPDGYVFSHKNSSTRLWRKTRTTLYSNDPHCIGVDGNRNFGYEWSDSPYRGGNSNPCTDNYSGPQGFSEPETRNLRSLLLRLGSRTALFLSLHSYGQFFLFPWGYDASATIEDEPEMLEVGERFADAMWRQNRWYEFGSSAKVLYAAAGASDDYAKGGAGVKYSFTVELSPTDSSPHGFLLPSHRISTVVNDHWPAFKAIARIIWDRLNETSYEDDASTSSSNNEDAADSGMSADSSFETSQARIGRRRSKTRRRGENSASGLTDVTIDGHTIRLDMSNPAMIQWMQYYMEFRNYRRRLQGWRSGR